MILDKGVNFHKPQLLYLKLGIITVLTWESSRTPGKQLAQSMAHDESPPVLSYWGTVQQWRGKSHKTLGAPSPTLGLPKPGTAEDGEPPRNL